MFKLRCRLALIAAFGGSLAGCAALTASTDSSAPVVTAGSAPTPVHNPGDIQKISDLERQLSREQRQCLLEKRRLEVALKEAQKQSEDLQKKIDALLSIDRDLRERSRNR